MGTAVQTTEPDDQIIQQGTCLNACHASELSKAVTNDEIKRAVFSMPDNKAPGPDGYSASFINLHGQLLVMRSH